MITVALYRIAKMWKQPKCQSTNEFIQEMWYKCRIHIIQPVFKKKAILQYSTTWINLEEIMLSKIR